MAAPIPGFNNVPPINIGPYQSTYTSISQITGTPLIGNPEAMAQRLEELTGLVGTLAEALTFTAPAINSNIVNNELIAATIANSQQHINTLEIKTNWLEQQRAQSTNSNEGGNFRKPACESRALMSIKTLGSEKTGFKLWNQKFLNAVTQVHPGTRGFFEALMVKLDTARVILTNEEVDDIIKSTELNNYPIDINKLNDDVYFILVDKCEGEAATRVMNAPRGRGIEAYQNIYLWFAGQSGMALTKRMQWVMSPPIPKDDNELSEGLERWITQMTTLSNIGDEFKLATTFKFAALRILMTNKVDKFDQLKDQAKGSVPPGTPQSILQETIFTIFVQKLREYVTEKRLESNFNKKNSDDMDIGGVEEKEEDEEGHHHHEEEYDEWGYPNDINSFGNKGWGKQGYKGGKGGKGKGNIICHNCGKPGHIARDCPNPPAKGLGKGPQCYNCGEKGHIARNCPYPLKGDGKGKGLSKGYQKGL